MWVIKTGNDFDPARDRLIKKLKIMISEKNNV